MQRKTCEGRILFSSEWPRADTAPERGRSALSRPRSGRTRWLVLVFLLAIAGAGLLIARAVRTPTPDVAMPPTRPHEGVQVHVRCPSEAVARLVHQFGRAWASRVGAQLSVSTYDPGQGPETGPPAHAWVIPPARLAHWAAQQAVHAVPDTYLTDSDYQWNKVLGLYRDKLLVWNQTVAALPLVGEGLVCFYRRDLFEDAAHRRAFKEKHGYELAAPATWQQFADIAAFFHNQKRPGIDRPCPALPALPLEDDALDREYFSIAACTARRAIRGDEPTRPSDDEQFSFQYDLETGEPRIATPGFVYAVQLLQRLQTYRPPGSVAEPPLSFRAGEAVLCLARPDWIARFQEDPQVRGKFSMCRVPGSQEVFHYHSGTKLVLASPNYVPYLGANGWIAVVPRSNARPEAAFSLLTFLSDPRTSADIIIEPAWGGGIFRVGQLDASVGWQAFGLSPNQTEVLIDSLRQMVVHRQVQNPVLRLRIPDERAHLRALVGEIRAALVEGKDAEQALADAADRWRELDKSRDLKTRLADYRLSLGLLPQGQAP